MTRNGTGVHPAHEVASWVAFCACLRGLALAAVLTLLTLWPLLVLAGFIIAAHWAAELACGWEWLRC